MIQKWNTKLKGRANFMYNWTRLWSNTNGEPKTFSQLKELENINCLILLGDPGMGKTTELEKLEDDQSICINLRSASRTGELKNYIDNDEVIKKINKFNKLVLILDGFDEAIAEYVYISDSILNTIKVYEKHKSKIFLRIACRKGNWLNSFEEKLKKFWSEDQVQSYELEALSEDDIKTTLESEFNDDGASKFMVEVIQRDLKHLLERPITFKMLINKYKKSHNLPETQNELYNDSCEVLLSEPTEEKKRV